MARRRRRRRRKRQRFTAAAGTVIVLGVAAYFLEPWNARSGDGAGVLSGVLRPELTTDRPETASLDGGPQNDVTERGSTPSLASTPTTLESDGVQTSALIESARNALAGGDFVLSRAQYTEAMQIELPAEEELEVRAQLRKLGRRTIFSDTVADNDPFTSHHVIQPGETLHKIAKAHSVTAAFLARINNIADMNRIQAGRRIKVVDGPFHAAITRSTYTLDVYLGRTFIDHFKVGLGAEGGTPTGNWRVKDKLKNPTYYPPRGGGIIHADDAQNPLGERWIGLEGIDGDAVGQMRYGIHGTIDVQSIGKNVSMGCIRMFNEDVELLFDLLVEKKSTVIVRE